VFINTVTILQTEIVEKELSRSTSIILSLQHTSKKTESKYKHTNILGIRRNIFINIVLYNVKKVMTVSCQCV